MGRAARKSSAAGETRSVASAVMPEEESAYYADLEKKHWGNEAAGSRFTEGDLRSLLDSNPHLLSKEDSREDFLARGVPEDALLPGRSYFLLHARGEEGMIDAAKLNPKETVSIRRLKEGSLSFLVRGERQQTDVATAIVGDYPRDPTRRALITIFPGLPSDPARSSAPEDNELGLSDGQTLSLEELQQITGREDLLLQIKEDE